MRFESTEIEHPAPLLFRHAVPRTSSSELPGYYDMAKQLWVVETKAGTVPVVEAAATTAIETNTSTHVRQEGDDQDTSTQLKGFEALLDTHTLTKVQPEGDDTDITADETLAPRPRLSTLAELATKTDVQHESDDQMSPADMLELETRTLNNQEGVDETFPTMLLELQSETLADVKGSDDELSMIH